MVMKKTKEDYLNSEYLKTGKKDLILPEDDLYDPIKGHWDIYEECSKNGDDPENVCYIETETGEKLYGSKPEVTNNVHVAIDFGTRSTTVGILQDNKFIPIELGADRSQAEIETENLRDQNSKQFENPTILEVINYSRFIETYSKSERRPLTLFDDFKFSYSADISRSNVNQENYEALSYFYNLKQWTTDGSKYFIRSKTDKKVVNVPPFVSKEFSDEITEIPKTSLESLNPIEIYSYLIGCIINNAKDRRIIRRYNMSYPVSTKNTIKGKIVQSFKAGLLKTIPNLKTKNPKNEITISSRISEPVAYTVAVIDQLNIFENQEKIFYATFDFGGGTSDYSYGVVSQSEEDDKPIIDNMFFYGDKYLGGENLLYKLVYKFITEEENYKKFKENNIKFKLLPFFREEVKMKHKDIFEDETQAERNLLELIKVFRPFIEKYSEMINFDETQGEENRPQVFYKDKGEINGLLFNGEILVNGLVYNFSELDKILKDSIEIGVNNFLNGLKISLNLLDDKEKQIKKYILLGGNASKLQLFRNILENRLVEEMEGIKLDSGSFEIIPPLDIDDPNLRKYYKKEFLSEKVDKSLLPTAKTGVVYGTLKVANDDYEVKNSGLKREVPFLYNIISPHLKDNKKSIINFFAKSIDSNPKKLRSEWFKYRDVKIIEDEAVEIIIKYTDNQYIDIPSEYLKSTLVEKQKIIDVYLEDQPELKDCEKASVWLRVVDPEFIEYRLCKEGETPSNEEEIKKENVIERL